MLSLIVLRLFVTLFNGINTTSQWGEERNNLLKRRLQDDELSLETTSPKKAVLDEQEKARTYLM